MMGLFLRRRWLCAALPATLVLGSACRPPEPAPPAATYLPTATIKDLMTAIIDPSANVVWNAVATVQTLEGTEERAPRTAEEWEEVRAGALRLAESANLLLMPGRKVARPHEKSATPGVELEPVEIEALIAKDPAKFEGLARLLHSTTLETLKAIDARDPQALTAAGEHVNVVCETCHQEFWYPNQPLPPGYDRQ
jgi:hypothetical protein